MYVSASHFDTKGLSPRAFGALARGFEGIEAFVLAQESEIPSLGLCEVKGMGSNTECRRVWIAAAFQQYGEAIVAEKNTRTTELTRNKQ